MLETVNPMTENALSRLIKAVGREKGLRIGGEVMGQLGLRELKTPADLLSFANHLIRLGGAIEFVGRALKVSALLRGAVEDKGVAA
jgi:hypothetical protein